MSERPIIYKKKMVERSPAFWKNLGANFVPDFRREIIFG